MSETVTPAAAAAFAAQAREHGFDATAALASFGYDADGQPIQQQQPAAPPAEPAPAPQYPSELSPSKTPNFTPSELETAADTLSRHWTGDPATLRQALERAGLTEADDGDDPRTDIERDFDAGSLAAATSPDDYSLPDLWVNRVDSPLEDRAEATAAIRSALAELAVPKVLGSAVAGYLLDGVAAWDAVKDDPVSAARYHADQQAIACRILDTNWTDIVATVKPLVARLSDANKELLAPSGAFEHHGLLVWLYRSSELLTIRRGLERAR